MAAVILTAILEGLERRFRDLLERKLPQIESVLMTLQTGKRQEVIDEASPNLRARLGMRTYGTMGTVGGTASEVPGATLQSDEFDFPEYIIGEGGCLHPLKRVSRQEICRFVGELLPTPENAIGDNLPPA